jgi:delta14-sterol reductase
MDITTDGFGFMLSFGDLTWLPFTYGLQARYLAFHPVNLGFAGSAAIVALEAIGLYIFRVSNNEKGNFRQGKNPKSASLVLVVYGFRTDGQTSNSCRPREEPSS